MIPVTVIALQVVIPFFLIVRLFQARRRSLLASMLFLVGLVTYIAATAIAGLWLVLPWYTALAYLGIAALGVVCLSDDIRMLRLEARSPIRFCRTGVHRRHRSPRNTAAGQGERQIDRWLVRRGAPGRDGMALGAGALWREPAKPRAAIELVTTHRETYRRAA